jgi:hypothetical protein
MGKNELVQLTARGIKCDNQDCSYRDDSVNLESFSEFLNKPCPVCGENLLTTEDFISITNLVNLVSKLNSIVEVDESIPTETISISMDGSGKFKF